MSGFVTRKLASAARDAARADMQRHIVLYEAATADEAALILSSALLTRTMLRASTSLNLGFPDKLLDAGPSGDAEESRQASRYLVELTALREKFRTPESEAQAVFANGLLTWTLTLRCCAFPELVPHGRHLWKCLAVGWPGALEMIEERQPDLSADALERVCAPPAFFLPGGWEGAGEGT